jgi:lysophospholipase L1-like esterase
MNKKALVAIVLVIALSAIGACYTLRIGPFEPPLELSAERFYAVKEAIKRAPDGAVLVFGDSIVEGAPLPSTICGHAVINGGVSGAAIGYFERHAAELLGSTHPRLIVLAVGINNASTTAAVQFQSHYDATVALLSRGSPVAVATVTPVRSGPGAVGYQADLVPTFNAAIRATPEAGSVIDLNGPLLSTNLTSDGIHFGDAGYKVWIKAMTDGITHILGCAAALPGEESNPSNQKQQ